MERLRGQIIIRVVAGMTIVSGVMIILLKIVYLPFMINKAKMEVRTT